MHGWVIINEPEHVPTRAVSVDVFDELNGLTPVATGSVHDDRLNAVTKEITHAKSSESPKGAKTKQNTPVIDG